MRVLLDECVPRRLARQLVLEQDLRAARAAVIVMVGASNQLVDLLPLVPDVLVVLGTVQAGDAVEVRA